MADFTRLLDAAAAGDTGAAADLLPLVYDELRKLAANRMAAEAPGHTLQPTALVHEAYLRLVGGTVPRDWHGRGHFFAAAAEAMRCILIDAARRKQAVRHGGAGRRLDILDGDAVANSADDDLLDLNEALTEFAATDPQAADVVKLRVFAGATVEDVAQALGVSPRTAKRDWAYAQGLAETPVGGVGRANVLMTRNSE